MSSYGIEGENCLNIARSLSYIGRRMYLLLKATQLTKSCLVFTCWYESMVVMALWFSLHVYPHRMQKKPKKGEHR